MINVEQERMNYIIGEAVKLEEWIDSFIKDAIREDKYGCNVLISDCYNKVKSVVLQKYRDNGYKIRLMLREPEHSIYRLEW